MFNAKSLLIGAVISASMGLASTATAAVVGVTASSYEITHESGFGQTDGLGPKVIPGPNVAPPIEYSGTLVDGTNSSSGWGGAATVFWPDLAGLIFPSGTGVSQDWTDADPHDAASLRIDFSVDYLNAGTTFGPPTFSFAYFFLAGFVSTNGWVEFEYGANFTADDNGQILGGTLGDLYRNDTPGAFNFFQFEFNDNNNFAPVGSLISLEGFIEFRAFDGDPINNTSTIRLASRSGIAPVPIPATLPMLGSVLVGGLFWARRRRRAA